MNCPGKLTEEIPVMVYKVFQLNYLPELHLVISSEFWKSVCHNFITVKFRVEWIEKLFPSHSLPIPKFINITASIFPIKIFTVIILKNRFSHKITMKCDRVVFLCLSFLVTGLE